jgi:hypothetical protein
MTPRCYIGAGQGDESEKTYPSGIGPIPRAEPTLNRRQSEVVSHRTCYLSETEVVLASPEALQLHHLAELTV